MSPDKLDKFNVISSCNLSSDDIYSLTLLYKPLIGNEALSIYLSFNSMLERSRLKSSEMFHIDYYDMQNINEKEFYDARLRLEAIGLLTTYKNEDSYIYIIKTPMTPKQFLIDGTFGLYLYSKIGDKMFKYLLQLFRIEGIDKSKFINVTVSFDDIFKTEPSQFVIDKEHDYLVGRKPNNGPKINNFEFEWSFFVDQIDTSFIDLGVTESFKKFILDIAYAYGFDENDLESLYIQSINKAQKFDKRMLRKRATMLYQNKTKSTTPDLKAQDSTISIGGFNIKSLESLPASQLLDELLTSYPVEYLNRVNEIYDTIPLPRGVLNVMIMKVLGVKEGELPVVKYFEKVAETYFKNNILTVEDALKFATKGPASLKDSAKPKNSYKTGSSSEDPDWLAEYTENILKGSE